MTNSKPKNEVTPPLEIPPDALSEETLRNLIESFVLREGTDYGAVEVSLEKKVDQVQKQILSAEVKIVFDSDSQTVHLMTRKDFQLKMRNSNLSGGREF